MLSIANKIAIGAYQQAVQGSLSSFFKSIGAIFTKSSKAVVTKSGKYITKKL